jgi:hypothetical protein
MPVEERVCCCPVCMHGILTRSRACEPPMQLTDRLSKVERVESVASVQDESFKVRAVPHVFSIEASNWIALMDLFPAAVASPEGIQQGYLACLSNAKCERTDNLVCLWR